MDGVGFEKKDRVQIKKREEEEEEEEEEKRERMGERIEMWLKEKQRTHDAVICVGKQKFKLIIIGICTIKYNN